MPIVDGEVVPQELEQIFANGKQADVPVLIGSNADESTAFMPYFEPLYGKGEKGFQNYLAVQLPEVEGQVAAAYPANAYADVNERWSASDRCYQEVSYSKTTPRAILSYNLSDDVMLYGSYSMGYSSGGFNQDTRMRPYLPEISDNYELGAKTLLMDGRLRLNATAFLNKYQNQQLTVGRIVNGQPTADLINAQQATLTGFELDVLGQLSENLAVSVTAGYLEGEYDEFTVDDNVIDPATLAESIVTRDLSATKFGNNGSEVSFDVSVLHYLDLPQGGDITSSIGYGFKDDAYGTLLNTPSSKMDSYWLLDARFTWNLANDQTQISLWGSNLLDEVYVDTMLSQSGDTEIGGTDPSLGMTADYWGTPRSIGLETIHNF